jgi:hypothetical protein
MRVFSEIRRRYYIICQKFLQRKEIKMIKNSVKLLLLLVMLAGIVVSVVNLSSPLSALDNSLPESGGAVYDRTDINCNDPSKPWREKTNCLAGGRQLCDPKYCN